MYLLAHCVKHHSVCGFSLLESEEDFLRAAFLNIVKDNLFQIFSS